MEDRKYFYRIGDAEMHRRILCSVIALMFCFIIVGCSNKNEDDSFTITAYEIIPWSAYASDGPQVANPITFEISNVQVLERQNYSSTTYDNGERREVSRDNYYKIGFDLKIVDSSISDAITLGLEYLFIENINDNDQLGSRVLGSNAQIDDDSLYFYLQEVLPLNDSSWHFEDVIQTENDGELQYIVFHYVGEDGDAQRVYIKYDDPSL